MFKLRIFRSNAILAVVVAEVRPVGISNVNPQSPLTPNSSQGLVAKVLICLQQTAGETPKVLVVPPMQLEA
ncbi:hypothetical protein K402DRAFT_392806 [Aulographum hederae CBS 113979]|uniref:Secreted protein n=1 Tax=Aulographum hederae CBS 113979 TaxID=1176131 RepID=A0A6G1H3K8_9PEZI|nr:hypothetical protein K402DRAFT_392806 [Aulographum hederae CBS 113979]